MKISYFILGIVLAVLGFIGMTVLNNMLSSAQLAQSDCNGIGGQMMSYLDTDIQQQCIAADNLAFYSHVGIVVAIVFIALGIVFAVVGVAAIKK